MAKWFKHDSDSRYDVKIQLLREKFHAEGYGVYFMILEIIAQYAEPEHPLEEWGCVEKTHTVETLAKECGVSADTLRSILKQCDELGLFEKVNGRLFCKKILPRLDEYARRVLRKSEQSTHNVRTVSEQSRTRIDKNRIDKNRIDKKRESNREEKYSSLSHITEDDLMEIGDMYKVPIPFVRSVFDDLKNYVEAKGKKYKNYKAALRNWVKKDAIRLRKEANEQRSGKSKIAFIKTDE